MVMGDMLELGPDSLALHRKAVHDAEDVCDILIAVGELSASASQLMKSKGSTQVFICASAENARACLLNDISLRKNDVVLVKGSRAMNLERVFK